MKINKLISKVMDMFWINTTISELGIKNAASSDAVYAMQKWERMYKSSGGLHLPAAIASETARLVTLEMNMNLTGSKRAEYLNGQLSSVKKIIRGAAECACAFGGVMLKPYVNGGKIETEYITPSGFIPTEVDAEGNIVSAAFIDTYVKGNKYFTRIEQHIKEDNGYTIKNDVYLSDNPAILGKHVSLAEVEKWANLEERVRIDELDKPLFAYFKMPMESTLERKSPLGVSVFARAENLICDADRQYESLLWEFESAKRVVMADETAFKLDDNGNRVLPDERLYVALNQENLFNEWSPQLREQGIIRGLNEILRRIEFNCGLAYGTLSDVSHYDRTAEEIRASKQRSYSHISDIQAALFCAIESLVDSMNTLCDLYSLSPDGERKLEIEFDDSIVADRAREFDEKLQLTQAGIMSAEEFREWYF